VATETPMLILRQVEETRHERSAHLVGRTLFPLCGATFGKPDAWAIALVRPGTARICPRCWARRFDRERVP